MTLRRYTGLSPQRVTKDAKYSITSDGHIKLEFQESQRVRWLLTTNEHPNLVDLVNQVKMELRQQGGGAFYINEYHDVLVPDGQGGSCFWAGNYEETLVFSEGALVVGPDAPPGLKPGDLWPGPHVGIPYVLNAGATDIRYEKIDGRRRETVLLSDFHSSGDVKALTQRIGRIKGTSGGRIFINERAEMFAPVGLAGDWSYLYLGGLDEDVWFPPPDGFDRP